MIHILVSNEKTIFTDAPIFRISNPVSVHGRIGEKVKLECSVDSFSIPTFRWVSQTGYEIFENIDTFNKMSRLTVKSSNSVHQMFWMFSFFQIELKSQDDLKKTYKCFATNEIAKREIEFKINELSNGSNMKNVSMFTFILSAFLLALWDAKKNYYKI